MPKQKFYAIKNTNQIVTSWDECKKIIKGMNGVKFKSFKTPQEAHDFLNDMTSQSKKILR